MLGKNLNFATKEFVASLNGLFIGYVLTHRAEVLQQGRDQLCFVCEIEFGGFL